MSLALIALGAGILLFSAGWKCGQFNEERKFWKAMSDTQSGSPRRG